MGANKTKNKVEKDKCILCQRETPHNKDEDINKRFHYVECAGQLCRPCWKKIYGSGDCQVLG